MNTLDHLNVPPNIEEIGKVIDQLNNGTAVGTDGIIPELYKWGGTELCRKVCDCFRNI